MVQDTARDWWDKGLKLRDAQRMPEATSALARAVELAPESSDIAFDYAQICYASGLPAASLMCKLSQRNPNHLGILREAAAALAAEGHQEQAEQLLEHALDLRPDWVEGHQNLASLRFTAGDRGDFARSYSVACRAQPHNLALRMAWFYTLAMLREWSSAFKILDDGQAYFADARSLTLGKLYVACESGDVKRADILLQQTESIQDAGLDICRVRYFLRTGRIELAHGAATRLSQTPAARLAWPYLSLIWRLQGDARAEWLDGNPLFIQTFDLDFSAGERDELADLLRQLHIARAPRIEQSVRGGTQTERQLFFRHEVIIQRTKEKIVEAIRSYIAALPPIDMNHPLLSVARNLILFEGSWSVRLQGHGFHVSHTHPQGWISSAFYVSLPDVAHSGPAPAGWIQFGTPPRELNLRLTPNAEIQPQPGRLVLFPSTMWHSTVPFKDGERLVIAFDVRTADRNAH